MVKNLPSNAGHVGLIPGQGSKIPHAVGQLNPRAIIIESPCAANYRAHVIWNLRTTTTEPMCPGACTQQLERETPHATIEKSPSAAMKDPVCCN